MQKLHPRAVWLFFVSLIFRWLFLGIIFGIWTVTAVTGISEDLGLMGYIGWIVAFILVFAGLLYVWARLTYYFYFYELREDGFRQELGVISKKYITIPYDRIQNVDIHRSLLARILGLSSLNIQTAGASAQVSRYGVFGANGEGVLPGLSHEVAEQLRDELIRRAKGSRSQGL